LSKRSEDLLLFGFEELNEDEMAELAELTEDELRELDGWSQLRSDLKSLKEVPPCQLTSEHMKGAILREGIRTSAPARPWWIAWVGVSGVAAAACFGLAAWMTIQYYRTPLPESGQTQVASLTTPEVKAPAPIRKADPPKVMAQAEPAAKPASAMDEPDVQRLVMSVNPRSAGPAVRPEPSKERQETTATAMAAPSAAPGLELEESVDVEPLVPAPSPASDAIVVISPGEAGIEPPPAAEVGRAAYVVFGG
jgi:hypothetical protein